MVELRRQALSVVLVVLASLISLCQALPEAAAQLRLELTSQAGGLRLVNSGSEPIAIRSAIAVEKEEARDWVPVATEFHAVALCGSQPPPDEVHLAPTATLDVIPWRGFSCSGQCNTSCRANIYYGPGTFRFVVTMVPNGLRFISPTFTLPPQPEN